VPLISKGAFLEQLENENPGGLADLVLTGKRLLKLVIVVVWFNLLPNDVNVCRQTRQRQAQAGLGARGSTFNVELTGTYKERARKTFQQYFQEIN